MINAGPSGSQPGAKPATPPAAPSAKPPLPPGVPGVAHPPSHTAVLQNEKVTAPEAPKAPAPKPVQPAPLAKTEPATPTPAAPVAAQPATPAPAAPAAPTPTPQPTQAATPAAQQSAPVAQPPQAAAAPTAAPTQPVAPAAPAKQPAQSPILNTAPAATAQPKEAEHGFTSRFIQKNKQDAGNGGGSSSSTPPKKQSSKSVMKNVILGLVFAAVLVIGGGASYFLMQQNADLRQDASSPCDAWGGCGGQQCCPNPAGGHYCRASCDPAPTTPPPPPPTTPPPSSPCDAWGGCGSQQCCPNPAGGHYCRDNCSDPTPTTPPPTTPPPGSACDAWGGCGSQQCCPNPAGGHYCRANCGEDDGTTPPGTTPCGSATYDPSQGEYCCSSANNEVCSYGQLCRNNQCIENPVDDWTGWNACQSNPARQCTNGTAQWCCAIGHACLDNNTDNARCDGTGATDGVVNCWGGSVSGGNFNMTCECFTESGCTVSGHAIKCADASGGACTSNSSDFEGESGLSTANVPLGVHSVSLSGVPGLSCGRMQVDGGGNGNWTGALVTNSDNCGTGGTPPPTTPPPTTPPPTTPPPTTPPPTTPPPVIISCGNSCGGGVAGVCAEGTSCVAGKCAPSSCSGLPWGSCTAQPGSSCQYCDASSCGPKTYTEPALGCAADCTQDSQCEGSLVCHLGKCGPAECQAENLPWESCTAQPGTSCSYCHSVSCSVKTVSEPGLICGSTTCTTDQNCLGNLICHKEEPGQNAGICISPECRDAGAFSTNQCTPTGPGDSCTWCNVENDCQPELESIPLQGCADACTSDAQCDASAGLVCGAEGKCVSTACRDASATLGTTCEAPYGGSCNYCHEETCELMPVTGGSCGDGIVNGTEACDDGTDNSDTEPNACRTNCTLPVCGDGVEDNGEACDDGNQVDNDACTNACKLPNCGDGIVQTGEECDDGNTNETDSCRECKAPTCGDGVVDSGEQCDDGNSDNTDSCRNNCKTPTCGDGIKDSGEQCDDGNSTNGDGCDSSCNTEKVVSSTPPPTAPTAGCNDACVTNADCANSNYICYKDANRDGVCRLASNVTDANCTQAQPDLPATLPETGASDIVNWLKAGLAALGLGAVLLLML